MEATPQECEEAQRYYATHSPMTDPGHHADLLDVLLGALPMNVAGLIRAVQGTMTHRQVPEVEEWRLPQMRAHSAEEILGHIRELDGRPLAESRPPERRAVGNCAHAATLFCSLARQGGLPVRVRDGFAAYLVPDLWTNHRIVEYWDRSAGSGGFEGRWSRADAELDEGFRVELREERGLTFDPMDLPPEQFITASEVWQRCRAEECDWEDFGYPGVTGMGYVAQRVTLDLAALNKVELTPYDRWGLLKKREEELTEDDLTLLDQVAALTTSDDEEVFTELRGLYEGDRRLRVPPTVAYRDELGIEMYTIPVSNKDKSALEQKE